MNMKTVYLNNFMSSVVTELERNGQYSTAHVCGSVLRSVMVFDGDGLLLSGITPLWLKAYEHYLLHKGEKGLEWNTISTYMITCGYYACLTVNCVRLLCGGKYGVK